MGAAPRISGRAGEFRMEEVARLRKTLSTTFWTGRLSKYIGLCAGIRQPARKASFLREAAVG
jgi:hypothetical protein